MVKKTLSFVLLFSVFCLFGLAPNLNAISIRGIDKEPNKVSYSVFQWPTNNWGRNTNVLYSADLSCVGHPSESGGHPNWRINCTYIQGVDENGALKYYGITARHTTPNKDFFYKFVSADGTIFQNQAKASSVVYPPKLSWTSQVVRGTNTYTQISAWEPDICVFEFVDPFPDHIKPARLLDRQFIVNEEIWVYGFLQSNGIIGFGIYPSFYNNIYGAKSSVKFENLFDASYLTGDSGSPTFYRVLGADGSKKTYLVGIHYSGSTTSLGVAGVDADLTDEKIRNWLKGLGILFEPNIVEKVDSGEGNNGESNNNSQNNNEKLDNGGGISAEKVETIILNNVGPNSYSFDIDNSDFDSDDLSIFNIKLRKYMFDAGPIVIQIRKTDSNRLK